MLLLLDRLPEISKVQSNRDFNFATRGSTIALWINVGLNTAMTLSFELLYR